MPKASRTYESAGGDGYRGAAPEQAAPLGLQLEIVEGQHAKSFRGLESTRLQNDSGHVSGRFKTEGGCGAESSLGQQRTSVHPSRSPAMKTSTSARATALAVAILFTFGAIDLMAGYAYPSAPAVQIASAR
jgi:hypothetical protein